MLTAFSSRSPGVYINIGGQQDSIAATPGSLWVNPATGQPMSAHDTSPVVYQQGYSLGRPMYRGQHPMYAPSQQQSASYPYVMPVQYPGGPQQHYYLVQPQVDHTGMHTAQDSGGAGSHQIGYHNSLTGQLAGMSISHRQSEFREDDTGSSSDSYSNTPTPPPGASSTATIDMQQQQQQQLMMSSNPYVIMPPPARQMMSGQMYHHHNQQAPIPMQYVPGQGYVAFNPYGQYMAMPPHHHDPNASRYPQSHTPPVQQPRSPSPVMVGSPFIANPPPGQPPHISRPSPAQTPPFSRTPPPSSASYIRNTMPGSLPGSPMIIPVPQSPAAGSSSIGGRGIPSPGLSSAHSQWKGGHHLQSKRGGKMAGGSGAGGGQEVINYQALAQEGQRVQQNMASFSGHRPVVKMIQVPHFPLMPGQSRFPQSRNPYGHYSNPSYKRGKLRTPRATKPIPVAALDDEKKTVNHILEVYDMPEGITLSESENLLKELEASGGRILRINNSSVGSALQTSTGPTVLAIFKSASDAQNALESVKSPKFKLRVSQKSPTHITADNNVASRSSNTPST
eukprot:gene3612-4123_t